jgi:DNA excision repair protein ERCC-3
LILSKVGNFAIDLPDANVLIQVSGTFGSRQEEAQRLGRILRPKAGGEIALFYTLVTRNTIEIDFAHHRQLFLTEQGYSYSIADEADVKDTGILSQGLEDGQSSNSRETASAGVADSHRGSCVGPRVAS